MDDDATPRPGRRPSALVLLTAGALGAAVLGLGLGGAAYAQSSEPADPDAGVTQEECEDRAGRSGAGPDATSADA